MLPVPLLPSHHDPHAAPLSLVDRLDDLWSLVHKSNGTCDMVECFYIPHLFPWHWHVFKKLENSVGNVLESTQINPLVLAEPL